ncbi:MAG TPA: ScaI family restriction endonuclease [Usitatibacter sp.]|nr:ScaI family restriction endonuclease [Usitatibacter sp.]
MPSPYDGVAEHDWPKRTQELIEAHPLSLHEILRAAENSWSLLWQTTIGEGQTAFSLSDLDPPATVVGYLFEKLFARELASQHPKVWAGGIGSQKDLHHLTDESKSIEMKSSGQLGYKIFGNRSYGQQVEGEGGKKDKSGYYIAINFFKRDLSLLRFGWIDAADWQAQKSQTGQMAGLPATVYTGKLVRIPGKYELRAPVQILDGIGNKASSELRAAGILTIEDLVAASNDKCPPQHRAKRDSARKRYADVLQREL